MPTVTVPILAIPPLILAAVSAMLAGLGLIYWIGHWGEGAVVYLRAAAGRTVFWALAGLWMASPSASAAAIWFRLYLPAGLMLLLTLLEGALHRTGLEPVRWLRVAWAAAGVWLVVSLFPAVGSWYPALRRIPDGLWLGVPTEPLWLALVLAVVFGGAMASMVAVVVWGALRAHRPRLLQYVVAIAFAAGLFWQGGVFSEPTVLLPPFLWLGGVAISVLLWRDLRTLAVENHQRLNRDTLTGAASRGYGEIYGAERLADGPMGAVYVDLDRFKLVNDRLGHDAGDRLLRDTVERLKSVCRAGDMVVRLGGDELAVLFPGARHDDGERLTSRLRLAVEGTDASPVRLSLGWSWLPKGSRIADLIAAADDAMYQDKRARRASTSAP